MVFTTRYKNYWEKPFIGAHSDIGGSYQDTRNMDALYWMIQQGQAAGAGGAILILTKSIIQTFNF
ncbi:MAG: DUF2235 domain-containing protein [Verrucomicrobia bacterium]|nr:DUF2235 domain-containing protein [Verrucomicrobiota bacterium]